jgi:hypothetical protein
VTFIFPNRSTLVGLPKYPSSCDQWSLTIIGRINQGGAFFYEEFDDSFRIITQCKFDQQTVYRRYFAVVVAIDFVSKPVNPMKIRNVLYNCEIQGTGEIVHYDRSPNYPRPKITLECVKADQEQE